MKSSIKMLFCLLFICRAYSQHITNAWQDSSSNTGDNYTIYISLPPNLDSTKKYKAVYYLDGNLKSGKELRELLSQPTISQQTATCIFIGIGHSGNFHQQRRRDFIPNDASIPTSNVTAFYNYLKKELVPKIQQNYPTLKDSNSIIGHSFGGLFVFYCLFQYDAPFSNFYALSPSLWVSNYSIYEYITSNNIFPLRKCLYFVSGSKEKLNRILYGTEQMKTFLDKQQFQNLSYEYEVIQGKTHNSEVPATLIKILTQKLP